MRYPKLLVLVRHGETYVNAGRGEKDYIPEGDERLLTTPDHLTELTSRGKSQADATGIGMKDMFGSFDCLIDSGYVRAVETGQRILSAYDSEERKRTHIIHHVLLREKERGYTFNMTEAQANEYFPWLQRYLEVTGRFYARPPGGESHADICLRAGLLLKELGKEWAGKKVLLVCHGHSIRALRYHLEGLTVEQYCAMIKPGSIRNCGIFAYRFDQNRNLLVPEMSNEVLWQPLAA